MHLSMIFGLYDLLVFSQRVEELISMLKPTTEDEI